MHGVGHLEFGHSLMIKALDMCNSGFTMNNQFHLKKKRVKVT